MTVKQIETFFENLCVGVYLKDCCVTYSNDSLKGCVSYIINKNTNDEMTLDIHLYQIPTTSKKKEQEMKYECYVYLNQKYNTASNYNFQITKEQYNKWTAIIINLRTEKQILLEDKILSELQLI